MDLHPMIVHFPIALLSIYAVMELIRSKKLLRNESWLYVKVAFLILGTLGAFAALSSGEGAADSFGETPVVEVHQFWATTTTTIFGIIAGLYVIFFIDKFLSEKIPKIAKKTKKYWSIVMKIDNFLLTSFVIVLAAFTGLIAVTITGALGGAIVYGTTSDPIVAFVYGLFF